MRPLLSGRLRASRNAPRPTLFSRAPRVKTREGRATDLCHRSQIPSVARHTLLARTGDSKHEASRSLRLEACRIPRWSLLPFSLTSGRSRPRRSTGSLAAMARPGTLRLEVRPSSASDPPSVVRSEGLCSSPCARTEGEIGCSQKITQGRTRRGTRLRFFWPGASPSSCLPSYLRDARRSP